jgi:hypothetical protein
MEKEKPHPLRKTTTKRMPRVRLRPRLTGGKRYGKRKTQPLRKDSKKQALFYI